MSAQRCVTMPCPSGEGSAREKRFPFLLHGVKRKERGHAPRPPPDTLAPRFSPACSLLLGMFPDACPSFRLDTKEAFAQQQRRLRKRLNTLVEIERLFTGSECKVLNTEAAVQSILRDVASAARNSCPSALSSGSIPLHVASEAYSPLLHGFKCNPAFEELQDEIFARGRLPIFGHRACLLACTISTAHSSSPLSHTPRAVLHRRNLHETCR
jgi:hypothetical protein